MEQSKAMIVGTEGKNWPEDYAQENGNYINQCIYCGDYFKGNKHRCICKLCDAGSIEYWTKVSQTKKPEDNKCAHAGCWSQGEMTGFAQCMIKEVFPLRLELDSVRETVQRHALALASKEEEISKLKAAIWMLLHHVPQTPDFDAIRDKCKYVMNENKKL